MKSAFERNPASVPVGFLLNSGKKEDGDDRKCSPCFEGSGGVSVTARRTTRWPNPVWPPVGLFEPQVTSVVQIFREPPSRLRVPYQSDRGRSPSASCLMHDRPFHGAPQPSDEPWRRFHDAQLLCYVRLLPCGCPLESIFRLSKSQASYEPLDVIVRSSLPGRMAHSAITSPRVSLARNPTEPLGPPSIRLADPFRPGRMRRIQVSEDQLEN